MINTLQQIKDEWAKGDNFHNWDDLFDSCAKYDYERLESAIDEVAIRYAQDQNKELVEMLESMVNSWEAIPYGYNSVKDTQKWLSKDLHPNIVKMRKLIKKHKQS